MTTWWIDEPILLGTNNPTTDQLQAWYDTGFRTVISFLEEAIQPPAYDADAVEAMGYERHNVPLRDGPFPLDPKLCQAFVQLVEASLKRGGVVMHCMAGKGRTGAMAVVYWIGKGLSADQAMAKIHLVNPIVQFPIIQASFHDFEKARHE
jgi:protein-tyrosine phosphatase